jgi:hypothetical protein
VKSNERKEYIKKEVKEGKNERNQAHTPLIVPRCSVRTRRSAKTREKRKKNQANFGPFSLRIASVFALLAGTLVCVALSGPVGVPQVSSSLLSLSLHPVLQKMWEGVGHACCVGEVLNPRFWQPQW